MHWRDRVAVGVAAALGLGAVATGVAIIWLTVAGVDLLAALHGEDERGVRRGNTVFESVFLITLGAGAILSVLVPLGKIVARRHRSGPDG
ncbi:hypothetical protein L1857_14650 [Amycolatopsis thermalba]|uniref:Uncharacterized protein n=1 Tax=Amycolatopsis thermalba TaxID=944492 RepID=A0ABY4NV66_9PSEU|nr:MULTISPECIES: hypothetical protein [Amycolatopsis]UQS23979.1 hypothetical protein L1857_14650 [Amycolatopsis thermalba]